MTNKDIINNEITKNSAKTPGVGETGGVAPVLTIDGPSGSGKGTVAQRVASHLGWHLLDSGAIYRVLAYRALRDGVALDDVAGLCASAVEMTLSFDSHGMLPVPVCLDGEWVTSALRTESVAKAASQVAALAPVREKLLDRQRDFCQFPGLVADGREQ
ncbi:MAG: (d)CMP kinase [Gammaproteobacteria bacterium]